MTDTRPPFTLTMVARQADTLATRWTAALIALATSHPQLAGECLVTMERLAVNVEQLVYEASLDATEPHEHSSPTLADPVGSAP